MYVELTTGKDSFRPQGASRKRNVAVTSFVRVDDNGEGKKIIPVFEAYRKKLRGFREQNLVSQIPATAAHGPNVGGAWYVNRHEVAPNTEILLEYKHRDANSVFGEDTEYLLLVADSTAPLYQIRLDLPPHHLSAVPCLFFVGRFDVVSSDDMLGDVAAWKDYFDLSETEFDVSDILDPNAPEPFFELIQLEAAAKGKTKTKTVVTTDGKKRVKIQRGRRIRTK